MQILIIDNNRIERAQVVRKIKEATSCVIHESETLLDSRNAISKHAIKLVIAASNFNAVNIINNIKKKFDLPVIIISKNCNTHEAVDAIRAGAHDYVLANNSGISRLIKQVWELEKVELTDNKNLEGHLSIVHEDVLTCQSQSDLTGFMERYRLFFKNMVNGAALYKAIVNAKGEIIDFILEEVNPSFIKFTGLDDINLTQYRLSHIMSSLDDINFKSKLEAYALVTKTGVSKEFIHYSKGLNKWFKIFAFRPCSGYLASIAEDITEQYFMNEKLKLERKKALNVIEGNLAGTWEWSLKDDSVQINAYWKHRLGYNLDELGELTRRTWEALIHPDGRQSVVNVVDRFINQEIEHFNVEFQQQKKDGSWIWVNARGKIVDRDVNMHPKQVAGTLIDITVKKELELRLLENENRLQVIFDHAPATMFVVDDAGKVLKVNQTGMRTNKLANSNISNLKKGDVVQCANANTTKEGCGTTSFCDDCKLRLFVMDVVKTEKQKLAQEITLQVYSNGQLENKYFLASASQLTDNFKVNYLITLVDISDQKKQEQELKESNIRFKQLAENSSEGILVHKNGVVVNTNAAISKLSGYNSEELNLKVIKEAIPVKYHHLLDFNSLLDVSDNYEIELLHKDGYLVPVEIKSRKISDNEKGLRVVSVKDMRESKRIRERIAKAAIEAEELERQRISQELHDGLGPLLSMIKMLNQAYLNTINPIQRRKLSKQLNDNIEAALKHNSELSRNLFPQLLNDFGLQSAVEQMLKNIRSASGIGCHSEFKLQARLPRVIELTFYRIIAELINNTIKHTTATCIDIEISEQNDCAVLNFYNDGDVFDFDKIKTGHKGMGLFNVYNRVKALNGNLIFQAHEVRGINYSIDLPLSLESLKN
ncbi:PAS domain S-box protein [Carboxylicivirga marina]|uniref:PAS domain S-box protein n=1 Tax=Carboxylicivirga marina TaxID=2800988 RepID=UPI0025937D6B|nr:PAS domain S-box protein [uncultured Carboxylicivirga sp.]